jgi:hypothetical protein
MQTPTSTSVLRIAAILVLVLGVITAIILHRLAIAPQDIPFQVRNKDFANYWMAGRLVLDGAVATLFGPAQAYFESMQAVFGTDYPWHNWSYPPHSLFLVLPLGLTDFLPAMALFVAVTLALHLVALGTLRGQWTPMAGLLLLPFLVANLAAVQNGYLTAALLVAGLALRSRRPLLSGVLLGLLTIKPQLGFLVPVLLIVEGRWRVIAAAAVTAGVLVTGSALAFGLDSWRGYFQVVLPYQTEAMNTLGGDFPFMMGSAFGSARSLGFDASTALAVHLPFALAGAVLFALALRRVADPAVRVLALLLATFLISPYSVAYDFGALASFAALWPLSPRRDPAPAPLRFALLAVAVLPVAMLPLGQTGLPVTPLVLLLAFMALLASERAFSRPAPPSRATP